MEPFAILWDYREAFAQGFLTTLELVTYTAFLGTILGSSLVALLASNGNIGKTLVDGVAFCIASIPALVILFWLFYPGQVLVGQSFSPFSTALAALTIVNTFAIYRIIDDAQKEFPKQFLSAAMVCGLDQNQILWRIRLPILLRAIAPRWIDQQVVILHTSLFASLISVEEIFRVSQRINSQIYEPVIIYTAMAIIFLVTTGLALLYSKSLREKYGRDFSER